MKADEYLGSWDTTREWLLADLGAQYHNRCDSFEEDFPYDRRRIAKAVQHIREHIHFLGAQQGFATKEILRAIQKAAR
jgi:hypothetical protein